MIRLAVVSAVKPSLHPALKEACDAQSRALVEGNPEFDITIVHDYRKDKIQLTDVNILDLLARVHNGIVDSLNLDAFDYLLWIDSDVVSYPSNLPTLLHAANPSGVTAPMIFVDKTIQFYDWAAFIMKGKDTIEPDMLARMPGRNLEPAYPYWPEYPKESVVEMDSVGTVLMVPTSVYKSGARYARHGFTCHYLMCKRMRELGGKVMVCRDVAAFHANLPDYGEDWH